MKQLHVAIASLAGLVLACTWNRDRAPEARLLDPAYHHLGNDQTPDWTEASPAPEGTRYELSFRAPANARTLTLGIDLRSVDSEWILVLNGQSLGPFEPTSEMRTYYRELPSELLVEEGNSLTVLSDDLADDILVGNVRLWDAPLREALNLSSVTVRVRDRRSGEGIPARVTFVGQDGTLARPVMAKSGSPAVRDGLAYVPAAGGTIELPAGTYEVFAMRGPEWGLDRRTVRLEPAECELEFEIEREVDTTGFVACDTHIHTLTFSGHGDSTPEERVLTLAGEGVELAIATDHNHNTDYRPYQARLGLNGDFTAVTGNEVTTDVGHFNAFPLDPEDEVPGYKSADYIELVNGMRAKGAQVVILNHPRWPDRERGPFGAHGLDRRTGRRATGVEYTFDAIEVVNSTDDQKDPLFVLEDWFALLRRGERFVGVGSSDSHTVGDPVGQGRTYIASSTDDPSQIDVDEACTNLLAGRATVSMGLFVNAHVASGAGLGELVDVAGGSVELEVSVGSPSWITPRRTLVYLNGERVVDRPVPERSGDSFETVETFELDMDLEQDGWIVVVALGDPVGLPGWPMLNEYTLGATNPIWLDADGDGVYRAALGEGTR